MASLYDINRELLNCIDLETGEIIDIEKLNQLQLERDTKIENIALWIKNLKADIKAYEEEEKNFKAKKDVCKNKLESLTNYLTEALNGEVFKTTKVTISYRKSTSVQVNENAQLPNEYLTVKTETTPNKAAIKEALTNGVVIDGCLLVDKQNIQIK